LIKIVKIPNDLVIYIKKPPISYTFYTKGSEIATFFSKSVVIFHIKMKKSGKKIIMIAQQ